MVHRRFSGTDVTNLRASNETPRSKSFSGPASGSEKLQRIPALGTDAGTEERRHPYRVFTPYYRKGCLNADAPREPLPVPQSLNLLKSESSETLESLELLPKIHWDQKMECYWEISEAGGQQKMQNFFENGLRDYKEGRNFPAKSCVSRLSPYLNQGQISPNQAWYGAQAKHSGKNLDHFLSELGWREFSYSLLYHFPDLPTGICRVVLMHFPGKKTPGCWNAGNGDRPDTRLLMPECVNCGKPGTSTTVCA